MKRILITGATGNVGQAVVQHLSLINTDNKIIIGAHNLAKTKKVFADFSNIEYVYFNFEDPSTFHGALKDIDSVFLLRPPHISNVQKYIAPLIEVIKAKGINEIVFLSVQGADKSRFIPHHKIEKLILEKGIDYIFLRPSYFMQNLTTTLIKDIQQHGKIILPAGKAGFNWVDALNVGEMAAILLDRFDHYKNQAYEVTGYENKNFREVVSQINKLIGTKIQYKNTNPLSFYRIKRREGVGRGMILVMIMLHFFPRFQKSPGISGFYEKVTGKNPTSLGEFILREKLSFLNTIDNP